VVSVMPRITEAQQRERGEVGAVIAGSRATPKVVAHGFMEAAVSENVYAGVAMARRSVFMYGANLAKSPTGQVGAGLGATNSYGTVSLVPPPLRSPTPARRRSLTGCGSSSR
jgi:alkyl sulfatase BDS1-like metallo-beta-lactamase superfamily hydrolase